MTDQFFDKVREAGNYKHQVLNKYLHVWVSKLASKHSSLAFVDTCAGTGTYEDGKPGSPVLAASWNDNPLLANHDPPKVLQVHACESHRENGKRLVEAMSPWTSRTPPVAFVYRQNFVKLLPELAAATRSMPTLVFIDPYGIKDLTPGLLSPLLDGTHKAPLELLMRVPPSMFGRLYGWLRDRPRSEKMARTAESMADRLSRLGISIGDLEVSDDGPAPSGQMFDEYLETFRRRFSYVQPVPIRPSYFAAVSYSLVHCTNNAHGAAHLNDVVSTTFDSQFGDTVEAKARRLGQLSFLEPERVPRITTAQLEAMIVDIVSETPMTFIDLRAELALAFAAEFREQHHKSAVKELHKKGRLRIDPEPLTNNSRISATSQAGASS